MSSALLPLETDLGKLRRRNANVLINSIAHLGEIESKKQWKVRD
jgi:hypothetical protein